MIKILSHLAERVCNTLHLGSVMILAAKTLFFSYHFWYRAVGRRSL